VGEGIAHAPQGVVGPLHRGLDQVRRVLRVVAAIRQLDALQCGA
jgi:hypothetical protein